MTSKFWIALGAGSGFLCVAFGAFGAHALSNKLSDKALSIYQTGVHYQFMHALALIALGIWTITAPASSTTTSTQLAGWSFAFGSLVFSGSLYALALTDIKILGAITPFGGLAFLLGWAAFATAAWRS